MTGRSETLSDAVKEEAPGIGDIVIFNLEASLISKYPGSEMRGVPASLIRPMSFPFFKISIK